MTQYSSPTYVVITQVIEVVGPVICLIACLLLVRRAPLPALLGAVGAAATGASSGLWLAADRLRVPGEDGDLFWQLTSYGRSIGLAVVCLALVLALLRTHRRTG